VSDREIGAVVSALAPKDACRFLVDLANLQGGPDNITVVVIRVIEGAKSEVRSPQPSHRKMEFALPAFLPWPWASLVLGIVLALAAIGVTYARIGGGLVVFLLAAVALGTGLVGLFLQNRAESKATPDDTVPSPARVHRQSPCSIDLGLLKKLARAEALLEDRIRDRHWTADLDTAKRHCELAERHQSANELTDAFREFCLAMRPLSEAVERQRHKEEAFQPVWDKAE
jgi:protein phosphatase